MSAGSRQRGFTLLGLMIVIAVMGAGLAAYGELASHAAQREKEAELLFRGNQYRQAIAAYFRKERSYPQELSALLQDQRYPMPVRHLRKLYADPITGKPDWGLIEAPGGGIMGVFSTAQGEPIKSGGFGLANKTFADARHYRDWKFFHPPDAK
jgi:prepilin-type N-terminal cleavage/methylation domain-containing protein